MTAVRLIIVGAGPAGCAAALHAAAQGMGVTLIDEHPQSLEAMSVDAPYFYGTRMSAVLSDESTIADRVLFANDALLECAEAGVDVLTGTCVWGHYVPGENSTRLRVKQVGLADKEKSWLLEYDHLILAPGSRDLVLSFPGWHLPGVLGVNGAAALLERYDALGARRMVILGSGNAGLQFALAAVHRGIEIAAIVEIAEEVRGGIELAETLRQAGVQILCAHTVVKALGDAEVSGVHLVGVDASGNAVAGSEMGIECDTVCMAFGVVPNIELAAVAGCKMVFDGALGGWVPALDAQMRTSITNLYVVGDGAGVTEEMVLDAELARAQARRAVDAIAGRFAATAPVERTSASQEGLPVALQWLRSLVAAGGMDVTVCQCEDVSRRELLDVQPPRYLARDKISEPRGLTSLSPAGRCSQDLLKRLTRVGMGHCQGKRCRDQSMWLLSEATGVDVSVISPGSYRAPVRPLPLKVLAATDETDGDRATWPTWLHAVPDDVLHRYRLGRNGEDGGAVPEGVSR